MSESNPMPQLSLAPSAPVPDAESAVAAESIQQTAVPAAEDTEERRPFSLFLQVLDQYMP